MIVFQLFAAAATEPKVFCNNEQMFTENPSVTTCSAAKSRQMQRPAGQPVKSQIFSSGARDEKNKPGVVFSPLFLMP